MYVLVRGAAPSPCGGAGPQTNIHIYIYHILHALLSAGSIALEKVVRPCRINSHCVIIILLGRAEASPTLITHTKKSLYLCMYDVCMYMYVAIYVAHVFIMQYARARAHIAIR